MLADVDIAARDAACWARPRDLPEAYGAPQRVALRPLPVLLHTAKDRLDWAGLGWTDHGTARAHSLFCSGLQLE